MSAPTVSVIVPAYRAAHTIGRALDSVLAQTVPPKEIAIVDDGSPDDLAAVLKPYGDRVRLIHKTNGGAASARNLGIQESTGELIAFLDADDYWEPRKLEIQLEILRKHPEVGLTSSRWYLEDPDRPRYVPVPLDPHLFDKVQRATGAAALAISHRIWTSTVLVRRSVLGSYRFDEHLKTAEDVELWIRLVLAAPSYLLSQELATAVQTTGSLSRSDVAADYRNMLHVVHRNAELLGPESVRAWELKLYRDWAAGHLGHGEARAALRPALKRLGRQPWSPQGWWIVFKSAVLACIPSNKETTENTENTEKRPGINFN
jgi:glycosyltransferase involved in cell wall biosynthesis